MLFISISKYQENKRTISASNEKKNYRIFLRNIRGIIVIISFFWVWHYIGSLAFMCSANEVIK